MRCTEQRLCQLNDYVLMFFDDKECYNHIPLMKKGNNSSCQIHLMR